MKIREPKFNTIDVTNPRNYMTKLPQDPNVNNKKRIKVLTGDELYSLSEKKLPRVKRKRLEDLDFYELYCFYFNVRSCDYQFRHK